MRRRALGLLAVGLLTASCSSGAQKGAAPPPPITASTTIPSPTPSPTPFISSADEQGAFAFVRAYFDALNHASANGSVNALAPYRLSSCSCVKAEKAISRVYEAGGRIDGAHVEINSLVLGQHGPAFAKVTAAFAASSDSVAEPGRPEVRQPGERGRYFISLVRVGDRWAIDDLLAQRLK